MTEGADSVALLPGFRVLDLSSSMGAFCGKLLRDLGMEVVKVEPPAGDPTRAEPPFAEGHTHREGSLRFAYLNAGKRSITLDIEKEYGRELLLDLVARFDVVLESFQPGYLTAHNLGYERLISSRQPISLARQWADCFTLAVIPSSRRAIRRKHNLIITVVSSRLMA
jgi:crotonobetainyl-CoA:carnitine CoA-transferase CaiB-like acyl-CoA transferase